MKRGVTILLLCAAAVIAKPPQSVAVYMAGEEPAAVRGSYKVLGAELAKALAKNKKYAAVDRTDEAVRILSATDIFNKSGSVDVDKARAVGKQLAAQVVCIAEISEVMNSYHLEARLVNVETAEISKVVTRRADIAEADDVARTAQSVARELVDGKKPLVNFSFREIKANPDKAIAEYAKAIRKKPKAWENYYNSAVAYWENGDYGSAAANIGQAVRLNPNSAAARAIEYNNRAVEYTKTGEYEKAIEYYSQALRLDPNNRAVYGNQASAYANRATAYAEKGDYDKAIEGYDQALKVNPNNKVAYDSRTNAYHARAIAYGNNGDYERAISDLNQSLRFDPNSAKVYGSRSAIYSNRAREHASNGDYGNAIADLGKAIEDLDKAISLRPDWVEARDSRDILYNNRAIYSNRANAANK
jgi:tetratricopeptide (TPR) repeat protein